MVTFISVSRNNFLRWLAPIVLIISGLWLGTGPASAQATASIGNVSIGTRSGSQVGRDSEATVPTLSYCVTFTTDDQAMDYGYEVIDATGSRPPFGSAFLSAFVFVPDREWSTGSTLPPRTTCTTTTIENGKSYTIRAWVTSGSYDTRGSWAVSGSTAPTAASYSFVPPVSGSTTAPTTTSTTLPSSGSGGSSSGCPSSLPVRVESGGKTGCVSLEQQCATNPAWSDPARNLRCPSATGSTDRPALQGSSKSCSVRISSRRSNRVTLRFTTPLPRTTALHRFDVQRLDQWFVLGSAKHSRSGVALVSTTTQIMNERGAYRVRVVRGRRVICEGTLTVRKPLTLRGPARPASN